MEGVRKGEGEGGKEVRWEGGRNGVSERGR